MPRAHRRTPFRIVLEAMREPMLMLLLGGGVAYLALGDLEESIILLVFGIASILITVVQETRTERVLEAFDASPLKAIVTTTQSNRTSSNESNAAKVIKD